MKIIILAAGKVNRISENGEIPKCLLMLENETIIERQIRFLTSIGIAYSDIIVITGFKGDLVSNYIGQAVCINNEKYDEYDNSYSLYLGLEKIDDDVIILDSDLVFDQGVMNQVLTARDNRLFVRRSEDIYGETGVEIDSSNKLVSIGKHIEDSKYCYTGILKLSKVNAKKLAMEIRNGYFNSWYSVPLNALLDQIEVVTETINDFVTDINNTREYDNVKVRYGLLNENILVTGASGFLGNKIYNILRRDYKCFGIQNTSKNHTFDRIDLTDEALVKSYILINKPTIIIHTAALPDPDFCEKNQEFAKTVNVETTRVLIKVARELNIKIIFISTDYVFDGSKKSAYEVDDCRNSKNYYGITKIMAEDIVSTYSNSLIIRIPIIYGFNDVSDKDTFVSKVLRSLKNSETLHLDNKQIRYPVLTDEVAISVKDSLKRRGIIHLSSGYCVTKYTWAKSIARVFGYDEALILEDTKSCLSNRPVHTKLKTLEEHVLSDVHTGLEIMKNQMYCAFKLIYKSQAIDYVYGQNVGEYRFNLGGKLSDRFPVEVIKEIDCVVPVPQSGLYYAMGLADKLKKPYIQSLVKPDSGNRSFQIADIGLRAKTIREKIYPVKSLIKDKTILLVDEAIFTGVTLKVVCDMVKACGAKKIYIAIPTPLSKLKCNNYVQPIRNLVSQEYSEQNINNYFKVDGIFFQSEESFAESFSDIDIICKWCFGNGG